MEYVAPAGSPSYRSPYRTDFATIQNLTPGPSPEERGGIIYYKSIS
jgi:hypothetical protein